MGEVRSLQIPPQATAPEEHRHANGRAAEPHLVRNIADGRIYIVSDHVRNADGTITAHDIVDITAEFDELAAEGANPIERVKHGPALYAIASRVYDIATAPATSGGTAKDERASRISAIAAALSGQQ